jgi:hypothetical protein
LPQQQKYGLSGRSADAGCRRRNTYAHCYVNRYADGYGYRCRNTVSDADEYSDGNGHCDIDTDQYCYPCRHSDVYGNPYGDGHACSKSFIRFKPG